MAWHLTTQLAAREDVLRLHCAQPTDALQTDPSIFPHARRLSNAPHRRHADTCKLASARVGVVVAAVVVCVGHACRHSAAHRACVVRSVWHGLVSCHPSGDFAHLAAPSHDAEPPCGRARQLGSHGALHAFPSHIHSSSSIMCNTVHFKCPALSPGLLPRALALQVQPSLIGSRLSGAVALALTILATHTITQAHRDAHTHAHASKHAHARIRALLGGGLGLAAMLLAWSVLGATNCHQGRR